MNKIIYPWDSKDSKFNKEELNHITYKLKELGYLLPHQKLESKLLAVIDKLLPKICNDEWLLLTCNNNFFIKDLSNYLPVIYSYNTMYSCATTNNQEILDSLKKLDYDESAYEKTEYFKLTTLLVWNDIDLGNNQLIKYASLFYDLLRTRAKRKCSTVFIAYYDGDSINKNYIGNIFDNIGKLLGNYFVALMKEKVFTIDIPLTRNNPTDKFGRIKL